MAMASPALVISSSDLDRIKNMVGTSASAFGTQALARSKAQELSEKSKARAKSWGNTLEGSRRKKAQEKKDKLEREELERQKIDEEEARIQLQQRKATIDRANKLLYDESDRMKAFHSKMMLCDVLAEREAQLGLKTELKKLEHIREDRHLEMEKQNYRKMLQREIKEKETKEELSKLTAKSQKEQLQEYKDKKYREIEDQMLEGELLRRKAVDDLDAEQAIEKKKRQQAVQAVAETAQANMYLKQLKAEDDIREQRMDQKIEEYAIKKEKMLALRKQKEAEVFQKKQEVRSRMINQQAERLASYRNNEEERIEKQVKEKEDSDRKRIQAKEELHMRWEHDISKSRHAQINRKRMERERERAEDAETAQFLGEWCKVLDKQEAEEFQMRKEAAKALSEEHKKAVEISRRRKDEEKKLEEGVAAQAKKAMEADTTEFHGHAENMIRNYADEGKNVIPLIKELREFRKRVLD